VNNAFVQCWSGPGVMFANRLSIASRVFRSKNCRPLRCSG
jgi:hypothetical protein